MAEILNSERADINRLVKNISAVLEKEIEKQLKAEIIKS